MSRFIGRQVSVGLGIESTPGTEVAPTDWYRQLKLGFQRKTTVIDNVSALGRVEKVNDSAVVQQWAEGPIEGKLYNTTVGYLLYNILGSVATTDNADSDATIKDHTFTVNNTSTPPTLTVARKDPNSDRRHGLASLDDLEISVDTSDWVMLTGNLKAKVGTTATNTVAYGTEYDFTSKHVTVKVAANIAGLSGATALQVKSLKCKISRPSNQFFPTGVVDPAVVTTAPIEVTGEMVLQYDATTLESTWFANTVQALSIALVNTDVTIGTAARPSLTITLPRVRLNTFDMNDDLDNIIEQTVGFKAEYDTTNGLISAVLVNNKALYA